MLRPKEVANSTPGFNKIIGHFIHRLRSVREPGGSGKENEVCELDNELFKWSFKCAAEALFDERFGCLEEEINKEAQTFIKAVGDFQCGDLIFNYWASCLVKCPRTCQRCC